MGNRNRCDADPGYHPGEWGGYRRLLNPAITGMQRKTGDSAVRKTASGQPDTGADKTRGGKRDITKKGGGKQAEKG